MATATSTPAGASSGASFAFRPATRQQLKLRMAIDGPAGSGKTFTALRAATALGERIAVINTESGAINKYLGEAPDGIPFRFDILDLSEFAPSTYTEAILLAGRHGYDVLIIDSLSHAWEGEGGALDQVDRKSTTDSKGNKFTAWKDVTPQHRKMVDVMQRSPCHLITTMRTKTDYVLEANADGKMVPKKVGLKAIQREGMDYEFDVVLDMDINHVMHVTKTRCPAMDGKIVAKPGLATFQPLVEWLTDGAPAPAEYYAVTEDDLRAAQRAELAEMTPEQKREAARERTAKARARSQQQQANGHIAQASEEDPAAVAAQAKQQEEAAAAKLAARQPDAQLLSTEAQRQEIKGLIKVAFGDSEAAVAQFKRWLAENYGTERLGQLGYQDAGHVIKSLQGMEASEPATKPAGQAATTATNGTGHFSAIDNLTLPPAEFPPKGISLAIRDEQRDEIKKLAERVGWDHTKLSPWLESRGLNSLRNLTDEQGDAVIGALKLVERSITANGSATSAASEGSAKN